jgi:dihydrolipoamide dehydrogenase
MGLRISVVGAGPGGYVAAIRAAQSGAEVTLIEREAVGGTCLNWGCIPSKVMVSASGMMQEIKNASRFGIQVEGSPKVNMEILQKKMQAVIATQQRGIEALLKQHRVTLLQGKAKILNHGSLSLEGSEGNLETILWDRLILATGTRPLDIPFLPTDGTHCLSSNDFLRMETLPHSAIVLGAGVVGCEFASILSGLGCRVELVEMADRILPLPGLDAGASKLLAREFKKRGIVLHTGKQVLSMEKEKDSVRLVLKRTGTSESGKETLQAACLVLCAGRSPSTKDLGLENIGLRTDPRGYIPVNDAMETAVSTVYAIGDVTGPERYMLAHVASMEGHIAALNAMGGAHRMDYGAVPCAIFTEPEVAFTGMSLERAREEGLEAKSTAVLFRSLGKAHATDALAGEAVLVTEEKSGKLLGCHLVGRHASELVAEATLAIQNGLSCSDVAATLHPHPSFSEIFSEAAFKAKGEGLHAP